MEYIGEHEHAIVKKTLRYVIFPITVFVFMYLVLGALTETGFVVSLLASTPFVALYFTYVQKKYPFLEWSE